MVTDLGVAVGIVTDQINPEIGDEMH